jgi:hypothetical protein
VRRQGTEGAKYVCISYNYFTADILIVEISLLYFFGQLLLPLPRDLRCSSFLWA